MPKAAHPPLLQQLIDAVHEANYATVAADAEISKPIAHRVLYAAWRFVQDIEQQEAEAPRG